ncbi:hypothetical protein CK203_110397 [Vitis vinifera]|uniref:Uncharacterized protein n=1 Tax=Vitis vinifera TaxID=29760 RepID=A0A438BP93_VITVI|nr:hypothetical protein CK203_110397 [Vitis vinifera]
MAKHAISLWKLNIRLGGQSRVKHGLDQSRAKRCLDLNEMEELRNDAYINSKVAKQRMKRWHDQLISNKEFWKGQRVLLYDSRLHIFPGKLKSRWIGPFIIHQVHLNGVVELLNSNSIDTFKVNGHRLKPFIEPFKQEKRKSTSLSHRKPNQKRVPKRSQTRAPFHLTPLSQAARTSDYLLSKIAMAKTRGAKSSSPQAAESPKRDLCPRLHTRASTATVVPPPPQPSQPPAIESQIPSGMTPEVVIRRPWSLSHPLRVIWIAGQGHSTPSFALTQLLSDFSQSSGIPSICCKGSGSYCHHFTIDGRHGILGARHIAEALRASTCQYLLRKELPPNMFFIDALLRHNIFPLQHWVQRRGVLLETLFRIFEGFFFGPHHLIMAALLYFGREDFGALGIPIEPQLERKCICREIFTLDKWNEYDNIWCRAGAPAGPEHPEIPHPE